MPSADVRIVGLKATVRSLERMGVEVSDLKAAFRRIASVVTGTAKSLVHSRTGSLAANIRPGNAKNKAVVRAGSARVPYAGVINYGRYNNITGQEFLQRAAEKDRPRSVRLVEGEIRSLISRLDLK